MSDPWSKITSKLNKTYKAGIKPLEMLTEAQIKEVMEEYDIHISEQLEKDVDGRRLFKDKYGGWIITLRFPCKEDTASSYRDPKISSNGATMWWGPRMALLDNTICTVFFPKEWKEGEMFGFSEVHSRAWLFTYRGNIKIEYTWIGEKFAKSESQFIKEAIVRFDDNTIENIEDIRQNKKYKSEMGAIKYTFNPNQFLHLEQIEVE